jgi:hypothetical protein
VTPSRSNVKNKIGYKSVEHCGGVVRKNQSTNQRQIRRVEKKRNRYSIDPLFTPSVYLCICFFLHFIFGSIFLLEKNQSMNEKRIDSIIHTTSLSDEKVFTQDKKENKKAKKTKE